jgi:hypothetical protein
MQQHLSNVQGHWGTTTQVGVAEATKASAATAATMEAKCMMMT